MLSAIRNALAASTVHYCNDKSKASLNYKEAFHLATQGIACPEHVLIFQVVVKL